MIGFAKPKEQKYKTPTKTIKFINSLSGLTPDDNQNSHCAEYLSVLCQWLFLIKACSHYGNDTLFGQFRATLRRDFACVLLGRGAKPSLIGTKLPQKSCRFCSGNTPYNLAVRKKSLIDGSSLADFRGCAFTNMQCCEVLFSAFIA